MPHFGPDEGMWRYRALLPKTDRELIKRRVFMGEGGTPCLRARRIERDLGCREVWLKDETCNPTGSFKDRGTALGVAVLARLGFTALGTVSTGNMAKSVAAYAARAGMEATIWVGASTPVQKLAPVAVHGAVLLRIDAPYGEIYNASIKWSRRTNVPFINSDSALRVEGQKTIAYEIVEQLGGRAPDWLIVPTSSGGNFSAIAKGFQEAADGGWLVGHCRLVAVQSAECAPIVRGWSQSKFRRRPPSREPFRILPRLVERECCAGCAAPTGAHLPCPTGISKRHSFVSPQNRGVSSNLLRRLVLRRLSVCGTKTLCSLKTRWFCC